MGIIWVLACVMLGVSGQISMKHGMGNVGAVESTKQLFSPSNLIRMFSNPYVLFGVFLYASSSILWLGALSVLDISLAYPLISIGYILAALAGLFIFGEKIASVRWLGVLFILGGCFLISRT